MALPKRAFVITGISFLAMGFVILVNSFAGLTGAAIFEGSNINAGWIIALWFLISGIVILMSWGGETIRLYHAYPSGKYTPNEEIDPKKMKHGGFYMARTEEDAIIALQEVD